MRGQGKGTDQLKLTLSSDGILVKKVIDFTAEAEAFDALSAAVSLTDIMQTGDCMGEALRGQGKGKGQLELTLNSDGILVKKVIDFKAEAFAGAVSLTDIMQTEVCRDDALRRHGKVKGRLKLIVTPTA